MANMAGGGATLKERQNGRVDRSSVPMIYRFDSGSVRQEDAEVSRIC